MNSNASVSTADQGRALWLSTIATVCFAAWTIFSIIGVQIKEDLGLTETQFGLLVGTPILTGSLVRIALGIWTDQYGGRRVFSVVMLAGSDLHLPAVLCANVSADARRRPRRRHRRWIIRGGHRIRVALVSSREQGTALGIFGAGNVGAAVTKFLAPLVLVAYG